MPPAKTKQNEIGVKYGTKNGLFTLAYFDIEQASNISVNRDGKNYLVQDGKISHKGVELSYNGKLAKKWNAMIGLAYMDAKYKNMGAAAAYKNG